MAFTLPISMHKFRQMSDKTPLCIPWAATPLDARRARTRKVQKSRGRLLPAVSDTSLGQKVAPVWLYRLEIRSASGSHSDFSAVCRDLPTISAPKMPSRPFAYNYVVLAHNLVMCSQSHPPSKCQGYRRFKLSEVRPVRTPPPYPLPPVRLVPHPPTTPKTGCETVKPGTC